MTPAADFSTLTERADGTLTRRLTNGTQIQYDITSRRTDGLIAMGIEPSMPTMMMDYVLIITQSSGGVCAVHETNTPSYVSA